MKTKHANDCRKLATNFCLWISVVFSIGTSHVSADLTKNLVAYYLLNGIALDLTSNGFNGTIQNATPTTNRFGVSSQALAFNGANSFVTVSDSPQLRLATNDFTICGWVFETRITSDANNTILAKRGSGSANGWILGIGGQNTIDLSRFDFGVSAGGINPNIASTQVVTTNQWHHVAVVYHNASQFIKMFVDGALDSTASGFPSPNASTSVDMHIGNDSAASHYYFNGILDDFRIYSRALTDAEVSQLYSGPAPLFKSLQINSGAMTSVLTDVSVGQTIILQTSTNLLNWESIQTNTADGLLFSVTNLAYPSASAQFLRASTPSYP